VTATGERVDFKSAYALFTIKGVVKELEIEVDTYTERSTPLIGRQLLAGLITSLNGPEERVEISFD